MELQIKTKAERLKNLRRGSKEILKRIRKPARKENATKKYEATPNPLWIKRCEITAPNFPSQLSTSCRGAGRMLISSAPKNSCPQEPITLSWSVFQVKRKEVKATSM